MILVCLCDDWVVVVVWCFFGGRREWKRREEKTDPPRSLALAKTNTHTHTHRHAKSHHAYVARSPVCMPPQLTCAATRGPAGVPFCLFVWFVLYVCCWLWVLLFVLFGCLVVGVIVWCWLFFFVVEERGETFDLADM